MDIAARERAYVRVAGPDACDYLQRMVSNDVEALQVGDACPALLLTAKARLIAPLVVWRRGPDDFLVLTEPELGEAVRAHLTRMRLRAQCEIEPEEHRSVLVFGGEGIATDFPGAVEVLDAELEPTLDAEELERRRVEAGVPRWGRELDDRILPAEAGLDATHINFGKGCYPGQEPIARLHYRGKANRALRVLELADVPPYDAELVHEGKVVGRVTSAVRRPDGSVVALGYVRVEVPDDARLELAHAAA
jgi:folate-binding protein YgfZ